jgi:predicted RecB family nuclease
VRRVGGSLVVSPTDLTKFLACEHLTALDLEVAGGLRKKPNQSTDELLQLLSTKGIEHEKRYLESLRQSRAVVEIPDEEFSTAERAAQTENAIRAGADVIYQAAFLYDGRIGYADFLLRTDRPSDLGAWSYDVADTKLARRLKVPALLQMASYGEHLRRVQGQPPVTLTVVAGDGTQHQFPFASVESYARRLVARFDAFVASPPATIAEPVEHCEQCRWIVDCYRTWRASDHLSFVAFLGSRQRKLIEDAGITTMAELGMKTADDLPAEINRGTRERILRQARLQLCERADGKPHYELLEPVESFGLLSLPEPDPADLYLDFEADRYIEPDGREFLAGIGDISGVFTALWAHSPEEERALTEQLIDQILCAWQAYPGMHVYHYAPYEKAALTRLVQRHTTREAELDILLRAQVFVDLYAVVRHGMVISKESYSIKKLEAFYWGAVRSKNSEVAEALSSTLAYEQWLVDGKQSHLDAIEAYNKDDVDSTRDLQRWLEHRRSELSKQHGTTFDRPVLEDPETKQPTHAERAEQDLVHRLLDGGHDLLAGLVGWHRREDRPAWWEFFRYADLPDEELLADATALGGPGTPTYQYAVKRSHVWRYPIPAQETRLAVDDLAFDVDSRKAVGTIVALDLAAGWVDLKFGQTAPPPSPRGLEPGGPVNTTVLRASIATTADNLLASTQTLATRLIDRVVPSSLPVCPDETPSDALIRIGTMLDGEVLAVQGPPGTGKSYNAARLIREWLDQGKKVGVTSLSHSVIGGLLTTVGRPALQKATEDQWCGDLAVAWTNDNSAVVKALADGDHKLVGGSAWLWARPDLRDSVDVLIVDEAGQFSLANAVAVAPAARSMVLLGDPQQLTQPTLAEHPYGAGVSALEHLLEGHPTVPPNRGIFFDRTWRMHPDVNEFVSLTSYEGRLHSRPGTEQQAIGEAGPWSGTGLRWVPVPHTDNSTSSDEEAAVVADIIADLINTSWTNSDGHTAPVTADDILVVAPYNVQVAVLRQALPAGIRVGTVDKFQGREGAVVIYSLTSSSSADAPRGIDFLYDTHRLNVAISRAKALAIVVGSPALLDAAVAKPDQVPLINAYCRYVESALQVPI